MGGLDNYGAEDLYNMEDVWNDKPYDKPPKKVCELSASDAYLTLCKPSSILYSQLFLAFLPFMCYRYFYHYMLIDTDICAQQYSLLF